MKFNNTVRLDHLAPFEKKPVPKWLQSMNFDAVNMDAGEGLIFARQLEYIESTLYETKYPMLKTRDLFPVDYNVPSGAESFTYYTYDAQGSFELITNYSDDFRSITGTGTKTTGEIESFGGLIEYSVQDIRNAQMAGIPLNDFQFRAARRLWEERLDAVAFNGYAGSNLVGILNHPNIPTGAVPVGGGAATAWTTKTPDEILKDLSALVTETIDATNGVEAPDTVVLPHAQYELISTTARSANSDTTILEFFLRNNAHISSVVPWYKLKGAGTGGVDVMFSYRNDAEAIQVVIPQEFETFAPQQENMAFKIPAHGRTGGLRVRYPLSIRIKEGI